MKVVLEERMHLISIALFLLQIIVENFFIQDYSSNRTLGWGWDITVFIWWLGTYSLSIFIIGYLVLHLLKRRTNAYISALHVGFWLFNISLFIFMDFSWLRVYLLAGMLVAFLVNVVLSKRYLLEYNS